MKIRGSFVFETEKDSISGKLIEKRYLQLNISTGLQERVSLDKFLDLYQNGKQKVRAVSSSEVGVGFVPGIDVTPSQIYSEPNLSEALSWLWGQFKIENVGDKELIIRSEVAEFLELPWETVVLNETVVIREVICANNKIFNNRAKKHFLLLMSHSYVPGKSNLNEDINEEAADILKQIINDNKPGFRIENLSLLKYATQEGVANLEWEKFDFAHLLLHGEDDGKLCLEKTNDYSCIEYMKQKDFLDILKQKGANLSLVYLSFCFSGGGTHTNNLSYDLIQSGVSQFALGYQGSIKSNLAQNFSKLFYNFLAQGTAIPESFKKSLTQYKSSSPSKVPVFYAKCLDEVK